MSHDGTAIISFLAAFFLVRYEVKEAKDEELKVEGYEVPQSPLSIVHIYTRDPHLEAVGRFRRKPPTHLLSRCHSLCITLSAVGFVLAIAGIVCYAWARFPTGVSVFSTACVGVCLVAGVVAMS
jgi:hypothetical protein